MHHDTSVATTQLLLRGRIVQTPLLAWPDVNSPNSARLWLKAENLQRGGSFKIRGALASISANRGAPSKGVLAQSTGNHGIAVALAAHEYGLPATIVISQDASDAKVKLIREQGAALEFTDAGLSARNSRLLELAGATGYEIIDPYENLPLIAGQGTAIAEMIWQAQDIGHPLDAVIVPVGGGSALAGACLADGAVRIIAAEPETVPSLTAAMQAGSPVSVPPLYTIADGLSPNRVGVIPFDIIRRRVDHIVTVSESEIISAVGRAIHKTHLIIEPAAGAALAAAFRVLKQEQLTYTNIGVLLTGGNVAPNVLVKALQATTYE